mmetsp:Transcript_34112/g.79904  ORF Transcript_34112/g.79904 Transcript_34112/m.79904 type:complete len:243 (+) Transcript_34112:655-1383(+)
MHGLECIPARLPPAVGHVGGVNRADSSRGAVKLLSIELVAHGDDAFVALGPARLVGLVARVVGEDDERVVRFDQPLDDAAHERALLLECLHRIEVLLLVEVPLDDVAEADAGAFVRPLVARDVQRDGARHLAVLIVRDLGDALRSLIGGSSVISASSRLSSLLPPPLSLRHLRLFRLPNELFVVGVVIDEIDRVPFDRRDRLLEQPRRFPDVLGRDRLFELRPRARLAQPDERLELPHRHAV